MPIILTGVAARAHHAPNVSPNMRRNMYLYATRRNPAWWRDTPPNRWNRAVFGLIIRNPVEWTPRGTADEARFELAEGFALTRFRGVLLRPLGHSSKSLVPAMTAENMQPDYYRTISRASVPRVAMMRGYPPPSCSQVMPTQACATNVQPNSYSKVRFALIASARAASSSSGG